MTSQLQASDADTPTLTSYRSHLETVEDPRFSPRASWTNLGGLLNTGVSVLRTGTPPTPSFSDPSKPPYSARSYSSERSPSVVPLPSPRVTRRESPRSRGTPNEFEKESRPMISHQQSRTLRVSPSVTFGDPSVEIVGTKQEVKLRKRVVIRFIEPQIVK